jgi:hypothetical protein
MWGSRRLDTLQQDLRYGLRQLSETGQARSDKGSSVNAV